LLKKIYLPPPSAIVPPKPLFIPPAPGRSSATGKTRRLPQTEIPQNFFIYMTAVTILKRTYAVNIFLILYFQYIMPSYAQEKIEKKLTRVSKNRYGMKPSGGAKHCGRQGEA
jgi:hypothetical protein